MSNDEKKIDSSKIELEIAGEKVKNRAGILESKTYWDTPDLKINGQNIRFKPTTFAFRSTHPQEDNVILMKEEPDCDNFLIIAEVNTKFGMVGCKLKIELEKVE